MDKLGIGIVGCGNISTTYLACGPLFRDLEMRAVADLDRGAAEARAAEFGVRAESVEDLLKAGDIDMIVNLTVPAAHYEVSRRALEAGKHVYSEKPLVLTLEEGERLRELAATHDLRVGSAPDTFLGGSHQLARAALDEGLAGRVTGGTAHVLSRGMEHWHPNPDFFFQPGAGPVLDVGPYYVTDLIQLLGPVSEVTAISGSARETRMIGSGARAGEEVPVGTPTNIQGVLLFASGAIVTLGASWDVRAHGHAHIELYGEAGTLVLPDPNFFGGDVEFDDGDGPRRVLERRGHPFGKGNQINGDRALANYRSAGLADMAAALRDGRQHRCNLDLALHAVEVMTGLIRAGEERSFVKMTTRCERPAALSPEEAAALLTV